MKRFLSTILSSSFALTAVAQTGAAGSAGEMTIMRNGSRAATSGPAEYFTGSVRVDPLFAASAPSRTTGGLVTFEPGARSAWHTHPLGQVLLVTAGSGRVQSWGGPVQEIRPGDVIWTSPGVKHWHGAAPTTGVSHIAITEMLDGKNVEWLEKVTDAQAAPAAAPAGTPAQPTANQKTFGELAPKFVDLTDNLLFKDVWERPELSKRDRSLITVAALVAMHRPDQLRFHLVRAGENGVTQEQLVEANTHLSFYAGWPSGVTAMTVAKEVLPPK